MPLISILVGVVLPKVATPPARDRIKSEASTSPVLPVEPKTASDHVTVIVELFDAIVVLVIVGDSWSFNLTELFVCVVEAASAVAS